MTLKEMSQQISLSLLELKEDLERQRDASIRIKSEKIEEYKAAAAQGDLRENSAYAEALNAIAEENSNYSSIDMQRNAIENSVDESNYKPIGMIVMYSTFKLVKNDDQEYILKMYPEGVSDLDRHIISRESRLGSALWLKELGDVVALENSNTGELNKFLIKEIY